MAIFEPTCAYARWALKSRFLSVCMSLYQNSLEKKSYLLNYLVYWYQIWYICVSFIKESGSPTMANVPTYH